MDLSYRERSALASLVAVLVVYGIYFAKVMDLVRNDQLNAGSALGLMIISVIALVVIEVVFQIVAVIPSEAPGADERDKLIAAKAARNSGIALGAGIITTIMAILASEIRGLGDSLVVLTPTVIAQILLLLVVLAQVCEYLSQLYYYRRGI